MTPEVARRTTDKLMDGIENAIAEFVEKFPGGPGKAEMKAKIHDWPSIKKAREEMYEHLLK